MPIPIRTMLIERHARALDQCNTAVTLLRDQMMLDEEECEQLLRVLNDTLPGDMNLLAHRLRDALIKAIDVIRVEDGIAKLDSFYTALGENEG